MSAIKAFDSSYPGSMHERADGYYLCRNDHVSLALALIELIASRDREIADLRDALAPEHDYWRQRHNALLDIARRVEALLTAQRWLPDGDAPESVLLRDARAAIAKAEGGAE